MAQIGLLSVMRSKILVGEKQMTRLKEVKLKQDDLARDLKVAMRSLRDVNVKVNAIMQKRMMLQLKP